MINICNRIIFIIQMVSIKIWDQQFLNQTNFNLKSDIWQINIDKWSSHNHLSSMNLIQNDVYLVKEASINSVYLGVFFLSRCLYIVFPMSFKPAEGIPMHRRNWPLLPVGWSLIGSAPPSFILILKNRWKLKIFILHGGAGTHPAT